MEAMAQELIKNYIMSLSPKTKLVRILAACLKHIDLEPLFNHNGSVVVAEQSLRNKPEGGATPKPRLQQGTRYSRALPLSL
jgi:hypothetical protein